MKKKKKSLKPGQAKFGKKTVELSQMNTFYMEETNRDARGKPHALQYDGEIEIWTMPQPDMSQFQTAIINGVRFIKAIDLK